MVDFANSTQKREWFFKENPEKLKSALILKTRTLRAKIAEYFKLQQLSKETSEEKSTQYEILFKNEEKLLTHFTDLLTLQIKVLRFENSECLATAMAYLQRFYLHESIFVNDPQ